MITFEIESFATDGMIREKDFREKVEKHDWSQYDGKVVLIKGCSTVLVPQWAYLIVAIRLSRRAKKITFGDVKTQIPIYRTADFEKQPVGQTVEAEG